jgi:hypothetical protein
LLQKLTTHIAECLERAAKAEGRAAKAHDELSRVEYLEIAANWRRLARSFELVETLDRFLADKKGARSPAGRRCHISENRSGGPDWYWEILDRDGSIIARGLAETRDAAFVQIQRAEQQFDRFNPTHPRLRAGPQGSPGF